MSSFSFYDEGDDTYEPLYAGDVEPCQKCRTSHTIDLVNVNGKYWVECGWCGFSSPESRSRDSAIDAWNNLDEDSLDYLE